MRDAGDPLGGALEGRHEEGLQRGRRARRRRSVPIALSRNPKILTSTRPACETPEIRVVTPSHVPTAHTSTRPACETPEISVTVVYETTVGLLQRGRRARRRRSRGTLRDRAHTCQLQRGRRARRRRSLLFGFGVRGSVLTSTRPACETPEIVEVDAPRVVDDGTSTRPACETPEIRARPWAHVGRHRTSTRPACETPEIVPEARRHAREILTSTRPACETPEIPCSRTRP